MIEDFEDIFLRSKNSNDKNQKYSNLIYIKRKFLAYLVAARIPTIIITIAFFLLGEWYAIKNILINQAILMIIFLILVQFILGLTNFTFDKKIDIFARKHTIWVFKYISSKEMLISSLIFSLIGLSILWYYFDLVVLLTGVILIIITVFYSLPPIRFKTKPPMDSISNMLFMGSLPFILGWLSTGVKLNYDTIVFGLIMGIPVIAHYLILSCQDIKTDEEFGIKTSSVMLGYNWSINISLFLWIVLIVISIFTFRFDISTISFLIVLPILTLMWIKYRITNDYKLRQKNINFLLTISTLLWLSFIYLYLLFLTTSIIP